MGRCGLIPEQIENRLSVVNELRGEIQAPDAPERDEGSQDGRTASSPEDRHDPIQPDRFAVAHSPRAVGPAECVRVCQRLRALGLPK